MPTRCRLCTTNDRDGLVDELAPELWQAETGRGSWAEASPQWQRIFRLHADAMLRVLERSHG